MIVTEKAKRRYVCVRVNVCLFEVDQKARETIS